MLPLGLPRIDFSLHYYGIFIYIFCIFIYICIFIYSFVFLFILYCICIFVFLLIPIRVDWLLLLHLEGVVLKAWPSNWDLVEVQYICMRKVYIGPPGFIAMYEPSLYT